MELAPNLAHRGGAVGAVVLGMGRSGTSAVTRALVTSGFFAGAASELMEANSANPLGFWENISVLRANEGILERIGATWFVPPTTEAQLAARPWAIPRLRGLLRRLMAEADGAPLAVKDPRIGVLLKLWGPATDEALHPVLVVRNPVEIALSLATRDGTPTPFALASWELHTVQVLEFLNRRVVTVVPYEQLIQSPEKASEFVAAVMVRLSEECGLRVDPDAAPHAIEPVLRREQARPTDLDEHVTHRQAELWRFLESLLPGNQVLDVPAGLGQPTPAAEALSRCETRRLRQLEELEGLRAQVARCESSLVDVERARDDERVRADAAEFWLREIQASASWRLTTPLRATMRAFRQVLPGPRQPTEHDAVRPRGEVEVQQDL